MLMFCLEYLFRIYLDLNNNDNKENQIDQTDDIGVMNRNNNINNTVDLETYPTEGM